MAAKASFFPYAAAAPAEAQPPLKNEAAALRKTLADKAKRDEATAAQRRTLDARREEQVVARWQATGLWGHLQSVCGPYLDGQPRRGAIRAARPRG